MAERKLAAIMFTDVVGYTSLVAADEAAGRRVRERHRSVVRELAERHGGECVQAVGDESLSSFSSALDAVACAVELQQTLADDPELQLRIGIHVGDVVFEGDEVYGDGINVASRVRPLAEPGGICISDQVYDSVKNHPELRFRSIGRRTLKNVARPVEVFTVATGNGAASTPARFAPRDLVGPAIALATAGLLVFGTWQWLASEATEAEEIRSIVVFPLENHSGDPDEENFARAMTEALTSTLAKIDGLRVVSRTSAEREHDAGKTLTQVAESLGVDAVIDGSVLRERNRVRIRAQLIDAREDRHLWTELYDRDLGDVLALQAEVARDVAREISHELSGRERERLAEAPAVDPAAYEAYMRGWQLLTSLTPPDHKLAVQYFTLSTERDPGYAPAWAGLSVAAT